MFENSHLMNDYFCNNFSGEKMSLAMRMKEANVNNIV